MNNVPGQRQRGFTLIEVLVGMAIALIGMVAMFQATQVWEGRKRTTSTGSDAQVAGSIAMFSLERDIKMAGYGFGNANAMGCAVSAFDSTRPAPSTFTFAMAPVLITNGVGGLPDTLTVLYGNAKTMSSSQTFDNVNPPPTVDNTILKRTNTRTGLLPGETFIAAESGGAACGLFEITGNANPDGLSIDHGTGAYTNYVNNQNVIGGSSLQAQFLNNSGMARYNDGTAKGVGSNGTIFNLGTLPVLDVWQVSNRRILTVNNTLANQAAATEVAEGIIDLQAQYGIDANGDGVIAAGEWTTTTPPDNATWQLLRAIRFALLSRSQQYETTAVTPVAPSWQGGAFVMRNVDGTADSNPVDGTGKGTPNNWRNYRYRVYENVIPLRNLIWGMS